MNTISHILEHLTTGADLSAPQAKEAFDLLLTGEVSPVQAGAFLMGLRAKGETAAELSAADRKSTRLNSSHSQQSRMPSSA